MSLHTTQVDSMVVDQMYTEWDKTLMDPNIPDPPAYWQDVAVEVPASSRSTLYTWFVNQALPRAWSGARYYHDVGHALDWRVFNTPYELGYKYLLRDATEDLTGLVQNAISSAMNDRIKWKQWEDYQVALALEAGGASLCYNGQNFFDNAHPIDPIGITAGTFDNNLALALNHVNLRTALDVFRQMKDPAGMPIISNGPILLHVPEALRQRAEDTLVAGMLSVGTAMGPLLSTAQNPNPVSGAVQLRVNPYLNLGGTTSTTWYLTRSSGIVKPLMFRRRQGLNKHLLGVDSEHYKMTGEILFGSDADFTVSYTRPELALRSVG